MEDNRNKPMISGAGAAMAEAGGFTKSRIILTAAELDIFTRLDEKPCCAEELAAEKGLDAHATARVLDALASMGLLEKSGGKYRPADAGALYSSRHPETVLPMVLHMCHMWTAWGGLTEVVKTGGRTEPDPGLHIDDESWKDFIGAMHVAGRALSMKIASQYDAGRFKRLLDIGGASGTYTIAFLRHNPSMSAVIFDLEHVIPLAKERIAAEGLASRVDFTAGDFYAGELPKGCDFALLSAIIHQNGPEGNVALYTKIYNALEPGGTLLIRDHIMDEGRTKPPAGAMFAINMLVVSNGGDTYTFDDVRAGLEQAGFADVKQVRSGEIMDCLVEARKPA